MQGTEPKIIKAPLKMINSGVDRWSAGKAEETWGPVSKREVQACGYYFPKIFYKPFSQALQNCVIIRPCLYIHVYFSVPMILRRKYEIKKQKPWCLHHWFSEKLQPEISFLSCSRSLTFITLWGWMNNELKLRKFNELWVWKPYPAFHFPCDLSCDLRSNVNL